jgi:hypothetical protein
VSRHTTLSASSSKSLRPPHQSCLNRSKLSQSDRAGEAAIATVSGGAAGYQDIINLISDDYHCVQRFAKAMCFGTEVTETSLEHFVNSVPWSSDERSVRVLRSSLILVAYEVTCAKLF